MPKVLSSTNQRKKQCAAASRRYRAKHKQKHAALNLVSYYRLKSDPEWLAKRRAKATINARKWRAANPEKCRAAQRRYRNKDNNREKINQRTKRWLAANPDQLLKRRAQSLAWAKANLGLHRKYKLGITPEQFGAMLESQQHRCLVCRIDLRTLRGKNVHLDHCHSTNRVRGILCHGCNTALGFMKENAANLRALADYIEGFSTCRV
jgi:hypothetical protein